MINFVFSIYHFLFSLLVFIGLLLFIVFALAFIRGFIGDSAYGYSIPISLMAGLVLILLTLVTMVPLIHRYVGEALSMMQALVSG